MDIVNINHPPVNPVSLEIRQASIQRCVQSLVHACQCRDTDCSFPSCRKMKRIVHHHAACEPSTANCLICRQLVALCCYHGKFCTMRTCPVPYCLRIQKKIKDKKRRQLEIDMTAERRKDVTDLLLDAIYASTDRAILRMSTSHKESFAKKAENKIFQLADTVDDYHRLLAMQKWEIEFYTETRLTRQLNQRVGDNEIMG